MKNEEHHPDIKDLTIDDLGRMIENGFSSMEKRFDAVDERFDKLEGRMDKLDTRFDVLAGHYAELSENVKKLTDANVSHIELNERLRPIEQKLGIPSPS
jgi:archaellum component FlaC